MVITKYSLIGAILQYHPSAVQCFDEMGMHCAACHMSPKETLEQACQAHPFSQIPNKKEQDTCLEFLPFLLSL